MKRIVLLLAVAFMALAPTLPALAQVEGNDEAANQAYLERLTGRTLPPGTGIATGLWGWDPNGEYKYLGLYDLAAICTNYGGYYYETSDTPEDYYWQRVRRHKPHAIASGAIEHKEDGCKG